MPADLPDAVAWVQSAAEISEVMKLCSKYSCPVVPFGAGTSLEGHVNARQVCVRVGAGEGPDTASGT